MKKILLSLLLASMLLTTACASETDTSVGNAEVTDAAETTAAEETTAAPDYEFPSIDLGGGDFTIANSDTGTWGHYFHIDFEEATGESLDDAVYERNRKIEEQFNFKLDVFSEGIDLLPDTVRASIMAGDDVYDVAYIRSNKIYTLISDGCLMELSSLDPLALDEDWWDQEVIKQVRIGEDRELFYASNYFSLMSFDGTICTYFNETMLDNLGMDAPYELVRSGKWTLDELFKYNAAGTNLNGDESFGWKNDGSCIYGLTTWSNGIVGLLLGCEADYITVDDDGIPQLTAGDEHFINVCDKLVSGMFAKEGEFTMKNATAPEHYEEIFRNGRALMLVAQIKTSSKYRAIDDTFGIVPLPKYDENQEKYISVMPESCSFMCIPMTNSNAEQTAALMDAFSYVSYRDVLPIYYEVNVSQKGLRNEASIEMLDIIRQTRVPDIGATYGWTNTMQANITNKLTSGSNDVMSIIDSERTKSEEAIAKTLELLAD